MPEAPVGTQETRNFTQELLNAIRTDDRPGVVETMRDLRVSLESRFGAGDCGAYGDYMRAAHVHSVLLGVFGHEVVDGLLQDLEPLYSIVSPRFQQSVSDSYGGIAVTTDRYAEDLRDIYVGAPARFMNTCVELFKPPISHVIERTQRPSSAYQKLWELFDEACIEKPDTHARFMTVDRARALRFAPFNMEPSPADITLSQAFEGNLDAVLEILVCSAIALAVERGTLPEVNDLVRNFQGLEASHIEHSRMNRWLSSIVMLGRTTTEQVYRARLQNEPPPFNKTVLQAVVEYVRDPACVDLRNLATEGAIMHTTATHGNLHAGAIVHTSDCAGARAAEVLASRQGAAQEFGNWAGSRLPLEELTLAHVVLPLGNAVAEQTIYCDETTRAGMQAVADAMRDQCALHHNPHVARAG